VTQSGKNTAMFFLFSPIAHYHDSPIAQSSDESCDSVESGRAIVSFGRVHVKHVHETDQVEWTLSCSVDDYELNRMHHARERRKTVAKRGSLTLEQILEWNTIEAYKYMAQSHSLVFQRRQRKRQAEEQNLNAHQVRRTHPSDFQQNQRKAKSGKRNVKSKVPLFWF
jgi:hypothetical protein